MPRSFTKIDGEDFIRSYLPRQNALIASPRGRVSEENEGIPAWLMARFAELAAEERVRRNELQEAADRDVWRMRKARGDADRMLREAGFRVPRWDR